MRNYQLKCKTFWEQYTGYVLHVSFFPSTSASKFCILINVHEVLFKVHTGTYVGPMSMTKIHKHMSMVEMHTGTYVVSMSMVHMHAEHMQCPCLWSRHTKNTHIHVYGQNAYRTHVVSIPMDKMHTGTQTVSMSMVRFEKRMWQQVLVNVPQSNFLNCYMQTDWETGQNWRAYFCTSCKSNKCFQKAMADNDHNTFLR
jgi:hypothetical protein